MQRPIGPITDPRLLLCASAICAFAAMKLSYEVYEAYLAATEWPAVEGLIVASSAAEDCGGGRGGPKWSLKVSYSYVVKGQRYVGNRLGTGGGPCSSQQSITSAQSRYPVGSTTFVYFDPRNPANARLEASSKRNDAALGYALMALVNACCSVWLIARVLALRKAKVRLDT